MLFTLSLLLLVLLASAAHVYEHTVHVDEGRATIHEALRGAHLYSHKKRSGVVFAPHQVHVGARLSVRGVAVVDARGDRGGVVLKRAADADAAQTLDLELRGVAVFAPNFTRTGVMMDDPAVSGAAEELPLCWRGRARGADGSFASLCATLDGIEGYFGEHVWDSFASLHELRFDDDGVLVAQPSLEPPADYTFTCLGHAGDEADESLLVKEAPKEAAATTTFTARNLPKPPVKKKKKTKAAATEDDLERRTHGGPPPTYAPVSECWSHSLSIIFETDGELYDRFGGDLIALTNYVGLLVSTSSVYYIHDVDTSLVIQELIHYTDPLTDPWEAGSTGSALAEIKAMYETDPQPRTVVHQLIGNDYGTPCCASGIAYVGALCSQGYGYGVTNQIGPGYGTIDPAHPLLTVWDLAAFSHELGHNSNGYHSHEMCNKPTTATSDPVDTCVAVGGTQCPHPGQPDLVLATAGGAMTCPGQGMACATIMSYAQQIPQSWANVAMTFGGAVKPPEPDQEFPYGKQPLRIASMMHSHISSQGSCTAPLGSCDCGNGQVDPGEQCEPPSTSTCRFDCQFSSCGDGFVNVLAGEECDDSNTVSGDGCSATCLIECGNGVLDGVEECDPPDAPLFATCRADCTAVVCGDGIIDTGAGETCDDGNVANDDGCDSACLIECGNGQLDGAEECDPPDGGVTCRANCTTVICGDSIVDTPAGEMCDSVPNCLPNCQWDCSSGGCCGFDGDGDTLLCDAGETCTSCPVDCVDGADTCCDTNNANGYPAAGVNEGCGLAGFGGTNNCLASCGGSYGWRACCCCAGLSCELIAGTSYYRCLPVDQCTLGTDDCLASEDCIENDEAWCCVPSGTTPAPTPVVAPTKFPTPFPTPFPSNHPTPNPTTWPTQFPTPNPTASPTKYPTPFPSPSPTNFPTPNPTASPSKYPTPFPTPNPTAAPTKYPTPSPTKYPSPSPTTASPTASPTANPTKQPIIGTAFPTPPTAYPTSFPTPNPTASPTKYPTPFPTPSPTSFPTQFPTPFPTNAPVAGTPYPTPPTLQPSASPTKNPTSNPTASPTKYPTPVPTLHPTPFPTAFPTPHPTEANCQPSCNCNGVCEWGESCSTCPITDNCLSGFTGDAGASCPNFICEAWADCQTCSADCAGGGGKNKFCCGSPDGVPNGRNPVNCNEDARCTAPPFICELNQTIGEFWCCGDGQCLQPFETTVNCPADCSPPPSPMTPSPTRHPTPSPTAFPTLFPTPNTLTASPSASPTKQPIIGTAYPTPPTPYPTTSSTNPFPSPPTSASPSPSPTLSPSPPPSSPTSTTDAPSSSPSSPPPPPSSSPSPAAPSPPSPSLPSLPPTSSDDGGGLGAALLGESADAQRPWLIWVIVAGAALLCCSLLCIVVVASTRLRRKQRRKLMLGAPAATTARRNRSNSSNSRRSVEYEQGDEAMTANKVLTLPRNAPLPRRYGSGRSGRASGVHRSLRASAQESDSTTMATINLRRGGASRRASRTHTMMSDGYEPLPIVRIGATPQRPLPPRPSPQRPPPRPAGPPPTRPARPPLVYGALP